MREATDLAGKIIKIPCLFLTSVNILLQSTVFGGFMNRSGKIVRTVGLAILCFGVGILCSFFLPEAVLVVIEALVIISVGCLWFCAK